MACNCLTEYKSEYFYFLFFKVEGQHVLLGINGTFCMVEYVAWYYVLFDFFYSLIKEFSHQMK